MFSFTKQKQTMQALITNFIKTEFQEKEVQIESKELKLPIAKILPFLNPKEFNAYCKKGCENYSTKWTCPPHCPPFIDYAANYTHIKLILYKTNCNQFDNIKEEERATITYNFTKDLLQNNLRNSETNQECFIGPNSCEICSICKASQAEACHLPHMIRYNLVAFGFNVSKIMKELFKHELEWSKEGHLPNYVSSVAAILLKI